MNKKNFIISFIFILTIITSACSNIDNINIESDKSEVKLIDDNKDSIRDELNIPLTNIITLDPLENKNPDYDNFIKLVYESLFEFDESLKVTPLLVENYDIKDEGRLIELKLRDSIYWHNGDELTSEDIAFTIEQLKKSDSDTIYSKKNTSALGSLNNFNMSKDIDVKIIDKKNIQIYFKETYGNNLESLTFPIVNKKSYDLDDEYRPIGTGPYMYEEYKNSQGISLIKNDKYWNGQVNISKINGKFFENIDLMLQAFEDGRIDILNSRGSDLEKYRKNPHVEILEYVSGEYEFLGFNFKNKIFSGKDGKKIRKAIYYGIDRQAIIGRVYDGHATQVDRPFHPNSYLSENIINSYGYNIEKSKALLREAGFTNLDKDEILKDNLGRKLEFRLITNFSNELRRKTAEIIKEDLKKIGINIILDYSKVNIGNLNDEEIDKEWIDLNNTLNSGGYDLAILGWEISVVPNISYMYHSSFIERDSNFIKYEDKFMDETLQLLYSSSREEKSDIAEKLQLYIMDELPYASLFFRNEGLLLKNKIEGPLEPSFYNLYKNIEKCKIIGISKQ